jgi:hypothetical protein
VKQVGCRLRRTTASLLPGLALLMAGHGQAQVPEPEANPVIPPAEQRLGEVGWTELDYSARKFFLAAHTTLRAERVPAGELADALPAPPRGRPVPLPEAGAVALSVKTDLPFGRDETVRVFIDPATGAALGGEKTMLGGSAYHKLIRYTDCGLFTWRSAPENSREAAQPARAWTHRKEYLVEPAVGPPEGTPVSDPYVLIYLATAARLDRKDSRLKLVMLAEDRFVEVTLIAGNLTYSRARFQESWPVGARARTGDVLVRIVRATAKALGATEASEDVDLGFLGMRGALTIYLEVGTALPVALSGRVQHIGEVTVSLDRAVLTGAPAPEAAP